MWRGVHSTLSFSSLRMLPPWGQSGGVELLDQGVGLLRGLRGTSGETVLLSWMECRSQEDAPGGGVGGTLLQGTTAPLDRRNVGMSRYRHRDLLRRPHWVRCGQ